MNEIYPSVRDDLSIRATHEHIGHRLQAAAQDLSAMPLLTRVRPVDRELFVRGAATVVLQLQEKLPSTSRLRPSPISEAG